VLLPMRADQRGPPPPKGDTVTVKTRGTTQIAAALAAARVATTVALFFGAGTAVAQPRLPSANGHNPPRAISIYLTDVARQSPWLVIFVATLISARPG
jgi:hypothetical protein